MQGSQFISVYENFFPNVEVRIKTKSLHSPWIAKGIAKSSKRKQKLYEKYLKGELMTPKQHTNCIKIYLKV